MTLTPIPFISTPSLLFLRYSFHPFLPHPSPFILYSRSSAPYLIPFLL